MYTQTTIPFTAEAVQELKTELRRLEEEKAALLIRLQAAREMGDLSENGAYKYAKIEIGNTNRRIREIKQTLHSAVIVQKQINPTTVNFGCTVTLQQGTRTRTYMLVSQHESDLTHGKLSMESPIGQAILGKSKGDTVTAQTPAGLITLTITDLR